MAHDWFEMFKAIRSRFALLDSKFMPPKKFKAAI